MASDRVFVAWRNGRANFGRWHLVSTDDPTRTRCRRVVGRPFVLRPRLPAGDDELCWNCRHQRPARVR